MVIYVILATKTTLPPDGYDFYGDTVRSNPVASSLCLIA